MKTILITGGTVFVSRYTARWFVDRGYDVYVLNRGNHPQEAGVRLIRADRHQLGDVLRDMHFDAVLDVCAYDAQDVDDLLNALGSFGDYILISSSAVYPEDYPQPFSEDMPVGPNAIWGRYGTDKIVAENALLSRLPTAYVLRPPYLYGPMQNVYREPFVFECALKGRPFFIPRRGEMKLQFFHVGDLCKMMEAILCEHPPHHILNVGNSETVSVTEFVSMCYRVAGVPLKTVSVPVEVPQRSYFSFHDYEYSLDVSRQKELLPATMPLLEGLSESFAWYLSHPEDVVRKDYISFIDQHLISSLK